MSVARPPQRLTQFGIGSLQALVVAEGDLDSCVRKIFFL